MNDDTTDKLLPDDVLADLDRDEAWLTGVMAQQGEPECRLLEQTKHRVRIEVLENALTFAAVPGPADEVLDQIKLAMRTEMAVSGGAVRAPVVDGMAVGGMVIDRVVAGGVSTSKAGESWRVVAGSLAVAAALTFAFLPWARPIESAPVETGLESVALFAAAVESVSGEVTYNDEELWTLSVALEDMEDEWVVPSDSWFDDEVGDLEDDIDRLASDSAMAWDT